MQDDLPESALTDSFRPPDEPCECYCLHCRRVFMSDRMWYQRVIHKPPARESGFWLCPTHNCDGAGFTMDIFPTDPSHPANAGWTYFETDDEDDEEWEEDASPVDATDEADTYDPAEPKYAELDAMEEPEDDLEGEEWKLGLQPGERPVETPEMIEAEQRWEKEQERYDEPDDRPRVLDRSDEPDPPPMNEDDIPF